MKTSILILFAILVGIPTSAWGVDELRLENLNLSYQQSKAVLNGNHITFLNSPLSFQADNPQFDFSIKEGFFSFEHPDFNFSYDFGKESFLAGLKEIETESLNVTYLKENRLEIFNSGAYVSHKNGKHYIPELNLKCAANPQENKLIGDLSNMCLWLGSVRIPVLEFDQLSGAAVLKALTGNEISDKSIGIQALDRVEEVALNIMNKDLYLSFKARFLFKWKVKVQGRIDYDENRGIVTINIDSAKAGIFSIKKTILKKISEANLESVTVEGDNITIHL